MINSVKRLNENPESFNNVQMVMGLIYTMGYPEQLACWIMSGMKKETYDELKCRIKLYGQMPESVESRGLLHAKKLDDTKVNNIIRQLKTMGNWRDMPKAEYRDMQSAIKNGRLS